MQSQGNSSLHPMELSNKKDKIFASCLEKAETSNLLFRHGCIATYSGKIIAKGCNTYNNYSRDMFFNNSCSCHAEINVLRQIYYNTKKKRKLNKIMKKTTLYISRCSTMHASADSAPCIDCLKMIKKLNSNNKLYASVGPCIGKKSYEVDILFYEKFVSKFRRNKIYFKNDANVVPLVKKVSKTIITRFW